MAAEFASVMAGAAAAHQAPAPARQETSQQRAGRARRSSGDPQRAQQGATASPAAAPAALDSLSRLQQLADASPQVAQLRRLQALAAARSAPVAQLAGGPEEEELIQGKFASAQLQSQLQQAPRANNTGLPDQLKSGLESLSGLSLDHVRVHYNSSQPTQLNALAYAQGSDIHLAPGQEQHLPHEAWHVVQQAQGRVRPTMQLKDGVPVNDDTGLEHEADLMGGKAAQRLREQNARHDPVASRSTPAHNVIQRAIVAPGTYLTGLIAKNGADQGWNPQWTIALNQIVRKPKFKEYITKEIDDEVENDILRLLRIMNELARLSYDKPNPYKIAMDAVRWAAGIESDSGGSGFGSLDTSASRISGRPAFPAITQANIPLKGGQHRRHILPWHSIREFVSMAYDANQEVVIGTILKMFNSQLDDVVAQAFAEAYNHVVSNRKKTGASEEAFSNEEWLKVGLFVMNGNPRNLWAGKGSTNSATNTAQMHMNAALDKLTTFKELVELCNTWNLGKRKIIYSTATALGADVLRHEVSAAHEEFALADDPLKEAEFVKPVAKKVRRDVVSNLELDVLADGKAQTEIALEKAKDLQNPIAIIDRVVTGEEEVAKIEPSLIEVALQEFMTYMK